MKVCSLVVILASLFFSKVFSQYPDSTTFYLKEFPPNGVLLDKGWRFYPADDASYAKYDANEKGGIPVNPSLVLDQLPSVQQPGIGWFRLKLLVDSSLRNKTIGMTISLFGAAEIYLNGNRVYQLGKVSANYEEEITQVIYSKAINLKLDGTALQLLAVHYSYNPRNLYVKGFTTPPCLRIILRSQNENIDKFALVSKHIYLMIGVTLTIVLAAAIINLFLYFSFRLRKEYFYFGLYFLCEFLGIFVQSDFLGVGKDIQLTGNEIIALIILANTFLMSGSLFALKGFHILFEPRNRKFFHFLQFYAIASVAAMCVFPRWGGLTGLLFFPFTCFEVIPIAFRAGRKHIQGAWIIFTSTIAALFLLIFVIQAVIINDFELTMLSISLTLLASALGLVIFLAGDFARTSLALRSRIAEVEGLSKKTIAQEKEKQEILATQNITLEKQVVERTAELSLSFKELKETQSQLIQKEKMASLGELTAGIAHEIQNPLNFVNNFSEVNGELIKELKNEAENGNMKEVTALANDIESNSEKINHHGKRADAIVKGMLQHSQTSTGIKQPTDINRLADEYLRLSYHGLRAKDKLFNAILQTDFDETMGKINIIPQDIGRVLLNLYNNAFYAVSEKKRLLEDGYEPTVSVSTKKIGDMVEIKVTDNGNGIPQKIVDKIFQPFFTTKPTGHGTGLGLSLSYDIVRAQGGEIEAVSNESDGAKFIIRLLI